MLGINIYFMNYIKTTYKSFINEDKENGIILYHGSDAEFAEFDDSKISTGDASELFGKGYYLTNNLKVAKHYAYLKTKAAKIVKWNNKGIFGTELPEYSDDADEYAEANLKVNKFIVSGNILNVKTYILPDEFIAQLRLSFERNSPWGDYPDALIRIFDNCIRYMRENTSEIFHFRGELAYISGQIILDNKNMMNDMVNYIRKLGYDGLKYESDKSFEGEGSWNYVIYNKSAIHKSI